MSEETTETANEDLSMAGANEGQAVTLQEHAEPEKASDDGIIEEKKPADLETVFDVPVKVSAVLGRSKMKVAELMRLGRGSILELDRKVGESIDIFVNNRLIARGEVVLVDNQLGVTMTEIISQD